MSKVTHPITRLPYCRCCCDVNAIADSILEDEQICYECAYQASKRADKDALEGLLTDLYPKRHYVKCGGCSRFALACDLLPEGGSTIDYCADCRGARAEDREEHESCRRYGVYQENTTISEI